jgi:hypothetical protein
MTNVHCLNGEAWSEKRRFCNNLTFWVSAYTERRTLVSGWGYTPTNAAMNAERNRRRYPNDLPFWDLDLLRRNDNFLRQPTAAEADALRREYGVRWAFADSRHGEPSPKLGTVLRKRFESGPITVYEFRTP